MNCKKNDIINQVGLHWGFFEDWCKACGICIELCPTNVYDAEPNGKPFATRPQDCNNCGICEIQCPDFAIGWYTNPLVNEQENKDVRPSSEVVAGDGEVQMLKIRR